MATMTNFDKVRNRIGTNSFKWDMYDDANILALGIADMDFDSPEEIRKALVERAEMGFFGYESISQSYYDAIIGWYERRYGWKVQQEWLSNIPGLWTGMRLCIDAFTEHGDAVLVHGPHFSPMINLLQHSGRRIVVNPLTYNGTQYQIDFESMERMIVDEQVKTFVMINPHNPTGRVFSEKELKTIGELCAKYKVPIISDEVHGNILFDGHRHHPACMVSKELKEMTAIVTAPSKCFNLQGLTYAILIIPNEELRAKFEDARKGYNMHFATNVFSLVAVKTAYSKCDIWLEELNNYLQDNLNYLTEYLKKEVPRIKVVRPEGSYMVWLDFRELGVSPDQLRELLLQNHIGLTYGEEFGKEGEGFERINIGCPRTTLEACLERLRDSVNKL